MVDTFSAQRQFYRFTEHLVLRILGLASHLPHVAEYLVNTETGQRLAQVTHSWSERNVKIPVFSQDGGQHGGRHQRRRQHMLLYKPARQVVEQSQPASEARP